MRLFGLDTSRVKNIKKDTAFFIGKIWFVPLALTINLTNEEDKFVWKVTISGSCMVKFLYADILSGHTTFLREYIRKLKVPLNIKTFMFFLQKIILESVNEMTVRNVFSVTGPSTIYFPLAPLLVLFGH